MELVFFVNVMEVSRHCQVVNQSMRVLIEKKRIKDIVSVFFVWVSHINGISFHIFGILTGRTSVCF